MEDRLDQHGFSADRPIQYLNEDLLERKGFAESLARAVQGWKGRDSLIIALYGVWGSGKSSVKNMALDVMKQSSSDTPEIVEFNPWQWAGQEGLLEAFFREIAVALGKADRSRAGRKRAARWRFYGAVLKTGSVVLSGLSGFLPWLIILASALGLSVAVSDTPWFRKMSAIILAICLASTAFFKWGGRLSERLASLFTYYAELKTKTLEEIKDEIKSDLEKLRKPVLVVIDDIDRLTKDETRLLIQLVKANADFPNIVYLLIFQRDIVERNLESNQLSGKDYLEKIVQVPFDIPQADQIRIEKVLFSELDRILEQDERITQRFDQTRWGNIFVAGLRPYFKTLRNVYRYLSTLSFNVNLHRGDIAFEVNPIDLIALEVLRVFEPDVYSRIAQNKEIFANIHFRDEPTDSVSSVVNSIIDRATEEGREFVSEIVKQLFPTIEWAIGGSSYGSGFADTWFRELRVCHPDVFSRYFQLAIPERDVSQSELEDIISKADDRNALMEKFLLLRDRNLLDIALNRLDSYKESIPIEHAMALVPALFDIGDILPSEGQGFFDIGPLTHASRIVYWYLRQEDDPETRGQIIHDSLAISNGLSLPASLLIAEEQRRERKRDVADHLITDSQLNKIKESLVTKIKKLAYDDPSRFSKNKEFAAALYRWFHWGSSDEVREWVNSFTQTREGLLTFLAGFTKRIKSQSMGDYVSRTRWEIHLRDFEEFISADLLRDRLAAIDLSDIEEEQKRALEAFQKALRRREQGKSDDDPWDDE